MAGLFPAEVIAFDHHPLQQVPVTHSRSNQADAGARQRQFQAKIAHDGSDHRLLGEQALAVKIERKRRHDVIAVDDIPLFTNKNGAVGIAVKRNPKVSTMFFHRLLEQRRMDGSASVVDVHAVRLIANHLDFGPQFP